MTTNAFDPSKLSYLGTWWLIKRRNLDYISIVKQDREISSTSRGYHRSANSITPWIRIYKNSKCDGASEIEKIVASNLPFDYSYFENEEDGLYKIVIEQNTWNFEQINIK